MATEQSDNLFHNEWYNSVKIIFFWGHIVFWEGLLKGRLELLEIFNIEAIVLSEIQHIRYTTWHNYVSNLFF